MITSNDITCKKCDKKFLAKRKQQKYCSKECRQIISNRTKEVNCGLCGKLCLKNDQDIKASKCGKVFCSHSCSIKFTRTKERVTVSCGTCGKECIKTQYEIQISKSGKGFCNRSCAATYNNKNKKVGTRVSKLETYLAKRLTETYSFEICFNRKDAIGSELDIYIPVLKLAFELNGIFHYEPIFGSKKLGQIKSNDTNKFQACQEKNISLCIIDTSKLIKFKESKGDEFFSIICSIITKHIENTRDSE
jgi:hypothetical protein